MKAKMFCLTQICGLLGCLLILMVAGNAQATIIDQFNTNQGPVNYSYQSDSLYDSTVIGGYRLMEFKNQVPSTGNNSSLQSFASPGALGFSNSVFSQSRYLVTWGGEDGTGFSDPEDLTDSGSSTYLTLRILSIDVGGVDIKFTVSDGTSTAWYTIGDAGLGVYQVPFTSFNNYDLNIFENTTLITMELNTIGIRDETDLALDLIKTGGSETIPEPSTLLLIGAGLMSVAGYATLRKRAKKG